MDPDTPPLHINTASQINSIYFLLHIVTPTHGKGIGNFAGKELGKVKAWNDDDVGINDKMVIYMRDFQKHTEMNT
jgi:hypothetical protein